MKQECTQILQRLTGKKHIVFTGRGNRSINLVLKLVKHLKITDILLQDQGGWITYKQYAKKLRLNQIELKTDFGLLKNIPNKKNTCLLINSMPAYHAYQENIDYLYEKCKEKDILMINDATGSIGTDYAKIGDFILGSLGKHKPGNYGKAGFIATNDSKYSDFFVDKLNIEFTDYQGLILRLNEINSRIITLNKLSNQIKKELVDFEIIHKYNSGFNVIVKFNNLQEKQKLMNYCDENNYPYFIGPHYIKVNADAVSIEVTKFVE